MKDQNSFKEKLYNYTLPVSDGIWERIEAKLPAHRRGFPFFWMSIIGGSLLIGALMIGLSLNNDHLKTNETTEKNNTQELINYTTTSAHDQNTIGNTLSDPAAFQYQKNESTPVNFSFNPEHKSTTRQTPFNHLSAHPLPFLDPMTSEATEAMRSNSRNSIDVTELSSLVIDPLVQENDRQEISTIKPNPSCYKFSGGGRYTLSADFFAGPAYSPRKFEDTGGESSLYAAGRNATESSQYAWAAGARVNLNLRQGLAIRLGIMYEQIGDKFNYTDTGATQISMVIDSFFAADGTFLYTESNTVTILGTLIKKIHNRYTHIDVPLILSYELPMGRATIMINAGPVINLTSTQRGQILDPMYVPKHITAGAKDQLDAYKNNLGLSVYLGAGALFPLTDNVSALIEPRYLYRIKPVTLDNYPLKEHRHLVGLNLGIRYLFD